VNRFKIGGKSNLQEKLAENFLSQ